MIFGRVLTAMVTPFKETGELHYEEAARLANYLIENGSDTLVVCGTTGESTTLKWEEQYELFRVVKAAVADRGKVLAGTGSNSTQEAIMATQKAAKLELDGSLQVVPYYNKPSQEGLYRHFEAIATCCDMPLLLYNIPGRSAVTLQPDTVARLADLTTIIGIKEASGSMDIVSQIRRQTPESFLIYAGDDSLTLPMLALGASGVVSVASHLVGPSIQMMIRQFLEGHYSTALNLHLQLLPLFKGLFIETNPVPIKAALKMQGWEVGSLRLPLYPLSSEHQQILQDLLNSLNLLESTQV